MLTSLPNRRFPKKKFSKMFGLLYFIVSPFSVLHLLHLDSAYVNKTVPPVFHDCPDEFIPGKDEKYALCNITNGDLPCDLLKVLYVKGCQCRFICRTRSGAAQGERVPSLWFCRSANHTFHSSHDPQHYLSSHSATNLPKRGREVSNLIDFPIL